MERHTVLGTVLSAEVIKELLTLGDHHSGGERYDWMMELSTE